MKTEDKTKQENAESAENTKNGNGQRMFVEVNRLVPDPEQPRKVFAPEKLKELADSIQEQGIICDLVVQPASGNWIIDEGVEHGKEAKQYWQVLDRRLIKNRAYKGPEPVKYYARREAEANLPLFEIVDGERRWRAAQLLKLATVPVSVRAPLSNKAVVQLVANQQHENLTALEEAESFRKEVAAGKKPEDLAKQLGVSRATVFGRLALTRLHPPVRQELVDGKISTSVAALVAMVPDPKQQEQLLKTVTEQNRWNGDVLSVRQVQELIDRDYVKQLNKAPWKLDEVFGLDFVKKGNNTPFTCAACPKRSGNMAESFPDLAKRPNVCTDTTCYGKKLGWWGAMQLKKAKQEGRTVVEGAKLFNDYETTGNNGERHDLRSSQYIDLDDRCEPLGWEYKNHWKAALGKECPPAVLAIDPSGRVRELLPTNVAMEALKKTGKKPKESPSTRDYKEDQRQARLEERERKEENNAVSAALVAKVEGLKDFAAEWLWKIVSEALLDLSGFYVMQPIEKRRGWVAPKGRSYMSLHDAEFAKMNLAQKVALAVEIATRRDEDAQNAAAKALRVDIKKIVATLKEERKAKKVKPKKPQPSAAKAPKNKKK